MKCEYEKWIPEYLDHALTKSANEKFLEHLEKCEICSNRIAELNDIDVLLSARLRPEPEVELLFAYQTRLEKRFPVQHPVRKFFTGMASLWQNTRIKPTLWFNLSRALALVVVGIFIGRFMFNSPQPASDGEELSPEILIIAPGSNDYKQISEYIVKSEILLLAIKNTSANQERRAFDLLPEKQLADDLLGNITQIQSNIVVLHDQELNDFLEKLELVLLEVSNSNDQDIVVVFREMKKVIDNTRMVTETQKLQQKIANMI